MAHRPLLLSPIGRDRGFSGIQAEDRAAAGTAASSLHVDELKLAPVPGATVPMSRKGGETWGIPFSFLAHAESGAFRSAGEVRRDLPQLCQRFGGVS